MVAHAVRSPESFKGVHWIALIMLHKICSDGVKCMHMSAWANVQRSQYPLHYGVTFCHYLFLQQLFRGSAYNFSWPTCDASPFNQITGANQPAVLQPCMAEICCITMASLLQLPALCMACTSFSPVMRPNRNTQAPGPLSEIVFGVKSAGGLVIDFS